MKLRAVMLATVGFALLTCTRGGDAQALKRALVVSTNPPR